jgi:hypothetical protein
MSITRQPNVDMQEFASLAFTLPTISATTTCALFTAPRNFRIDSIELISDATYTQDAANVYSLAVLLAGARTVGTWNTTTGQQGTITAAVPAAVPLAAESGQNRVAAKSEVVSFVATKSAAAANITLRVVVHGRFVG